jgi:hypothetical protein
MPKRISLLGYTIKELSPSIQKEVADENSEINTEYDWYDCYYQDFHEKLLEHGINCKDNFSWDLYRNTFEFNNLWIENQTLLLSKLEIGKYLIPLQMATNGDYNIDIDLKHKCVIIDIQDDANIKREELTEIEDVISKNIIELIEELESSFLKTLKNVYEDLTSEDAIIDTLEANEYLFTKEGKRI